MCESGQKELRQHIKDEFRDHKGELLEDDKQENEEN